MFGSPAAQVIFTLPSPSNGRARIRNEGFATSSPAHASSEMESQPAAIMSASAVLPEPRAPIIATRPGLRAITRVRSQGASNTSTLEITCDGVAEVGGSAPT